MEYDLRKIMFLNQLIQCPVDYLPLHRSAVCGAEYKPIICKLRSKEFLELFNLFLTSDQHFSNCFRQEYFPDTGLCFRLFQNQTCIRTRQCSRKFHNHTFIIQFFQSIPVDALQLFIDKDACPPLLYTYPGYVNAVPRQSEHFSHTKGTGKSQI